jgi:hypothetical protein
MEERRRGTIAPFTSLQSANASFITLGFKEIVFCQHWKGAYIYELAASNNQLNSFIDYEDFYQLVR